MRLYIKHSTQYHYDRAPKHMIQLLRLTPRNESNQRTIEWRVSTPGKQTRFQDAFGNISHSHVISNPETTLAIEVQGVVDVLPLLEGVLDTDDSTQALPTIAYLVPTPLTESSPAIVKMATETLPKGLLTGVDVLTLAREICNRVLYQTGSTNVTSTATQAFEQRSGVCQDHAHIMIAACRSLGIGARYVSGYVDAGHSREAASHAWVDVWLNTHWVSVDVTNVQFASDVHCRLAIGRDYLDACPIRGMREGGQKEQLDVSVQVQITQ